MPKTAIKYPRLALLIWLCGLVGLAAGIVALNVYMLRYAQAERARDYRTWLADASTALEAGEYEAARKNISTAQQLAPKHPEPHVSEGHLQYRLKKWLPAIEAYQHAIEMGSKDVGIRQNIVWAHIELGKNKEAAQLGRQYMEENRIGAQLPRYVAEAHFRDENFRGAIPLLKIALENQPGDLYLLDRLQRCYAQSGQKEQAVALKEHIESLQSDMSKPGAVTP